MAITGRPPNLILKNMRPILIVLLVAVGDLMLFSGLAIAVGGAG
jgi:hypothetical protein